MKCRPIEEIVYDHMFPKPKTGEPQSFQALLQRNLIPEVRQETHSFYGHLDTQEAKYPGLDYSHKTHRIRLSRWPWHRRLFRAFDALALTPSEIATLTRWEGTKWAKEKFEKEQGIIIRDTTADGFPDWTEPAESPRARNPRGARVTPTRATQSENTRTLGAADDDENENDDDDENTEGDDESDAELESIGVQLNERLRTQAARREAGETSAVLDEEWEQWLKDAIESGGLTVLTEHMTQQIFRRSPSSSLIPAALIPQGMLSLARSGQWSDIPEFLHPMLRRAIRGENPSPNFENEASTSDLASSISTLQAEASADSSEARIRFRWPRRTYSDLRLPGTEVSPTQQLA